MKNMVKVFIAAIILCIVPLFISCGERGGKIVVNNNYSENKSVTVYSDFSIKYKVLNITEFSYKDKYGPAMITDGSCGDFNVNSNTTYGIIWRDGRVDKYKTVEVVNGETVYVDIP